MNNQILDFLDFLNGSPTSIQASHEIVKRLEESGFKALKEEEQWALQVGGKYYVCDTDVLRLFLGKKLHSGYKIADTILKISEIIVEKLFKHSG